MTITTDRNIILSGLPHLTDREKVVVLLRYGGYSLTYEDIGLAMNISQQEVAHLHQSGLKQMVKQIDTTMMAESKQEEVNSPPNKAQPLDKKENLDNCENCYECLKDKWEFGMPVPATRMILCPVCGNKRCPKATNHILDCTNSNEPGQQGSRFQKPYCL